MLYRKSAYFLECHVTYNWGAVGRRRGFLQGDYLQDVRLTRRTGLWSVRPSYYTSKFGFAAINRAEYNFRPGRQAFLIVSVSYDVVFCFYFGTGVGWSVCWHRFEEIIVYNYKTGGFEMGEI